MEDEYLLLAAHEGSVGSQRAAIIMRDHCLPIALSHNSEQRESGIHACWESYCDVEDFFGALGIDNICRGMGDADPQVGGLFVYALRYVEPAGASDWEHLLGGEIRRPSGVELLRMSRGEAPWEGGLVL